MNSIRIDMFSHKRFFSYSNRAVSAITAFTLVFSSFAFAIPQIANAVALPMCNGSTATIYVSGGFVVGGTNNGAAYTAGVTVLLGGSGNDVIVGTGDGDLINAGNGSNKICALGGNDNITGGDGNDWIDAEAGNNTVNADKGSNTIFAGDGNNTITGGEGNDDVSVGEGNNTINVGKGSNEVTAGDGDNAITGGEGNDDVSVGDGDNTISLDKGSNEVIAGDGDNTITGGEGNDDVTVGDGDNTITLDKGSNEVITGDGDNTITGGDGNDDVTTGSGTDEINVGKGSNHVNSGGGDDTIIGGTGNDNFDGGPGYDLCNASTGSNTVINCELEGASQGIFIVKEASPEGDTEFEFTGELGDFTLVDDGESDNYQAFGLSAGSYTVTESESEDWTLESLSCNDTDGGTTVNLDDMQAVIDLDAGQSIVCTFSNEETVYEPDGDEIAPDMPIHLWPADGSIMPSSFLTHIDWTDVTDESEPVVYYYESALSTATSTTVYGDDFTSPVYQSGTLAVSEIPTLGTGEGTYFWHVRAVDDEGNSTPWTAPWSVTVDNTPPDVTVTIVKYIDGEHATAESANSASFPMYAIFPGGEGNYSLTTSGFNNPNPYEATTSNMPWGSEYSTYENPAEGQECTAEYPWQLDGYSVGTTLEDAAEADVTDDVPNFTDLTSDMFVIVHNTSCTPPPLECAANEAQTIVSDTETQVDEHGAVVITPHPAWTTAIFGATWIYSDALDGNGSSPTGDKTFTRDFTITGEPVDSTLEIATDNMYTVSVNGNVIDTGTSAFDLNNFSTVDTWNIPAADLVSGENTVTITVTNPAADPETHVPFGNPNPGGLLYKLTVNSETCPPEAPAPVKVHVYKHLQGDETTVQVPDESTLDPFAMHASWDASIGVGEGDYVLGNNHGGAALKYAADTSSMEAPVNSYSTYEVTDAEGPVLPVGAECSADKFRLVGYRSGNTLEAAEVAEISSTAPVFEDFNTDKYVIVVNEDCDDVIPTPVETSTVTMCKVDGNGYPLSGWTLMLKGEFIEGLSVPTNTPAGINTNIANSYDSGTSYLALASGTYLNRGGTNPADAEYSTITGWATHMDGFTGYGDDILDLRINNDFVNWGTYNSAHAYAASFTGANAPVNFNIFDGDTITDIQNESWFSDNSGTLEVNIYKGYAGITSGEEGEEEGCVTFNNVPVGEYTIDEVNQEGWVNDTDGYTEEAGELVTVDDSEETFTLMNTPATATLTIVKITTTGSGDDTFSFNISPVELGDDQEVSFPTEGNFGDSEGTGTSDPISLEPGTYDVTEILPDGWDLTGSFCEYDGESFGEPIVDGEQITVDGGDEVTCTFTNEAVPVQMLINNPPPTGGGTSGTGGQVAGASTSTEQVLGASTSTPETTATEGPSCDSNLLITTYMRRNKANDSEDVKRLQNFLNTEMGSGLPVSGIFGLATEKAVKAFQVKYTEDILTPWGITQPTGYVFKLTKWKINALICASLNVPKPEAVL